MTYARLTGRFLLLAIYAGVLMGVWPWVGDRYAAGFQAGGTNLCKTISRKWVVVLQPREPPTKMLDTTLALANRKTRAVGHRPISSRYLGYAPTAMLLALILASPVPWKRRAWAILLGLILMHVWIAGSLLLLVIHAYSRGGDLALFDFGPTLNRGLAYLVEVVVTAPVTKYAVPAVFWVLVTFRRSDWQRLMPPKRGAESSPADRSGLKGGRSSG